jgi:hypothetical protein
MTKLTTRKSTSTKLTGTQLIVLSRAVQREDGAATLPPCLLWGAHCEKQTLAKLLRQLLTDAVEKVFWG